MGKELQRRHEPRNSEFIEFVGKQFKQLSRRNLGLPMKLYHL
jgi:hypothetical protein